MECKVSSKAQNLLSCTDIVTVCNLKQTDEKMYVHGYNIDFDSVDNAYSI